MALSSIAIQEKNKLTPESVFLLCLKITIPDVLDPLYFVADTQDLTWDGKTWTAFDFKVDEITETSSGENPQIAIRVSNVSRIIEGYVWEYDTYCKNNGYSPILIDLYCVNTKAIEADPNCDPEVEHNFEALSINSDANWVSLTIGAPNPWNQRFPKNRMLGNFCRYRYFKGDQCGATTGNAAKLAASVCNRSLAQCRAFENSERFGGTPGVSRTGFSFSGNTIFTAASTTTTTV